MVSPSIWPPLASIIASKRGQKALQVFAIYSLDKLFQAFLIGAFKGFPIAMGCFAGLSLHNALHRALNNAKLRLATFNAPY